MSWITDDWRLKLLALGLAVLMLGAVAFSQNPPTTRTLTVPLIYRLAPNPTIIVTSGPSSINVTFSGLADVIGPVRPDNITAFADATTVSPGPAVKLNVSATSTIAGVNFSNPAPIVVSIDQLKTVEVPVEVVIPHVDPGWTVTKTVASCPPNPSPCKVHFSGPASWETQIRAIVTYATPINLNSQDSQNWPIRLQNSSGQINLARQTYPQLGLDVTSVAVHVEAQQGSSFTTVPLVAAAPAQPPPPQYQLIGITVSPASVVISGDPATLSKIQRITLPAVDLSAATSTVKVSVSILYPDNVTGNQATATITFIIQRNPNVTPSP
jgi:YbbR domain-containing protein